MESIIFPVFVFEEGGIHVFLRQEDIGVSLEHIDVRNSVYYGYDYYGRPLEFCISERLVVYCKLLSRQEMHEKLMSTIRDRLSSSIYCTSCTSDDAVIKCIAAGLFTEVFTHSPSLLKWIRNIFNCQTNNVNR